MRTEPVGVRIPEKIVVPARWTIPGRTGPGVVPDDLDHEIAGREKFVEHDLGILADAEYRRRLVRR